MSDGSGSSMSVVKSERLEGVEYWSNTKRLSPSVDVVQCNKLVGNIAETLNGLWEGRLYDPLEYLHTWTTLELAKHEVETALRTRELEAQIDTEILKDAEHQRQMILGWALIGLGIAIIAIVIRVLVEYAKIGG